MDSGSPLEALLIGAFESGQVVAYVTVSMMTLTAFDICIMFKDEFKYVWDARWSWGKIIYLHMRYGMVFVQAITFYILPIINHSTLECRIWTQFALGFASTIDFCIKVTQLLRTAALFKESKAKKRIIILTSISQGIVYAFIVVKLIMSAQPIVFPFRRYSCAIALSFSTKYYIIFYAASIVPDLLLSVACLVKIYQYWSEGRSSLAWIIARDILAYLHIITLALIPQVLITLYPPTFSIIVIGGFGSAGVSIASIACCRMILNMRSYRPDISLQSMAMPLSSTGSISEIAFNHDGDQDHSLESGSLSS